jgi:hypothetical protein
VHGDLGFTQNIYVGVPTQATNGPSRGALVTGYEVTSEFSPITSLVVPVLPAGAGGLTLEFGAGPQNVVAGQAVDFGPEGVQSFTLAGFDPLFASAEPDAFVMGLRFAEEGLGSIIGVPTLFIPPGDYNENGLVDAADYVLWRKNGGTLEEYNTWRAHFGQPSPSDAADPVLAGVPEPALMTLAACAVLLIAPMRLSCRRIGMNSQADGRQEFYSLDA